MYLFIPEIFLSPVILKVLGSRRLMPKAANTGLYIDEFTIKLLTAGSFLKEEPSTTRLECVTLLTPKSWSLITVRRFDFAFCILLY